jgi:hypothetical protein
VTADGVTEDAVLIAAAVEQGSDHPDKYQKCSSRIVWLEK